MLISLSWIIVAFSGAKLLLFVSSGFKRPATLLANMRIEDLVDFADQSPVSRTASFTAIYLSASPLRLNDSCSANNTVWFVIAISQSATVAEHPDGAGAHRQFIRYSIVTVALKPHSCDSHLLYFAHHFDFTPFFFCCHDNISLNNTSGSCSLWYQRRYRNYDRYDGMWVPLAHPSAFLMRICTSHCNRSFSLHADSVRGVFRNRHNADRWYHGYQVRIFYNSLWLLPDWEKGFSLSPHISFPEVSVQ